MTSHSQSPLISIPKKGTDDVDWTGPIRSLIAQSYGEAPDNYATECANLQRCRQDAVKGAGSELTARDLLYKYFGQLELLELRFAEIRVNFPWRDAFTSKLTTQSSIAFEKASIIYQIAATHSSIAATQSRSDPEGLKRAFYYLRTCAGMLTYINENFLHAPSTDLSREVIKFLVGLIQAQATEVFLEKCVSEKKGDALVSKIAAQVTHLYTTISEEVKDFMGKGIFERNWITLLQVKAQHFGSVAQYYRALADNTAGKHGDALVRLTIAEKAAKEAHRICESNYLSASPMSPNMPADAGMCLTDITKAQQAICAERKAEAQRDNDLIYNAVLPTPETLPAIDKAGGGLAAPIPIQEVYGTPEVQKVIGPDLFVRLIPLSVHESASVYSEEKAKLVRGEVEKADTADVQVRSAVDAAGIREGLARFRAMTEGGVGGEDELPVDVKRAKQDIAVMEERESVVALLSRLDSLKAAVKSTLDSTSRELESESRDCEAMRVKYEHLWTQEPSAPHTKTMRQDLKSHLNAFDSAAASDQQVLGIWNAVRNDIGLLLSPQVEDVFRASTEGGAGQESLLDLDIASDTGEQERARVGQYVYEIDTRLDKMDQISQERHEVLKELKEKVQNDDVSHILLLNRRNTGVEPTLFAAELEKFRPFRERLAGSVQDQQKVLEQLTQLWKGLKDTAGRGAGARKWDERERRKKDTTRRFLRARDGYMEVRDGLAKGLKFYSEFTEIATRLQRDVKSFVSSRYAERERLAGQLDVQQRLAGPASSAPPPLAAKPSATSSPRLHSSFASMQLGGAPTPPPPPMAVHPTRGNQWSMQPPNPHQPQYSGMPPHGSPAPPPPPSQQPSSFFPPPPPRPSQPSYAPAPAPSAPPSDPWASLGMLGNSAYSSPPPPPPGPAPPRGFAPPPAPSPYSAPQQASYQQQQQQLYGSGFPPPPQQPPAQPSYGSPLSPPPPPPPPPQGPQYGAYPAPPQPSPYGSHQGAYPPPPAAQGYQQYQSGYGR